MGVLRIYKVICDGCYKMLAEEVDEHILLTKIKKRKWQKEGGFKIYCPKCKKEGENE